MVQQVSISAPASAAIDDAARLARFAVAAVFFSNGVAGGSWFVRIPAVQQALGIGPGALGLALLGTAIGALVSMPVAGWLAGRYGSRPVTAVGAAGYCLILPLLALAPSLPWLVVALVAIGVAFGSADVAMNAQAVAVERRYRRPIMSSFHAMFSIGGMVGAALGGVAASQGIGPAAHLSGIALLLMLLLAAVGRFMVADAATHVGHGPSFALPSRSLLALGVVAFCVLVGEGAMADWTAVYLQQSIGTGPGLAAGGYAVFSLTMAAGRLAGDGLSARLGAVRLVRLGTLTAAAGLGLGLAVHHPAAALLGFAAVGAGLSCAFPLVVSAAGRDPSLAPGAAIAAVSTAGYTGFLIGPPLIGFSAELVGLRGALGLVAVLALAATALAGAVRR